MGFVIALLLGAFMGAVIVGGLWATFSAPQEPEAVEEHEERSALEQVKHYEAFLAEHLRTDREVEQLRRSRANEAWQGPAAWAEVMERGRQIQILEERKSDA